MKGVSGVLIFIVVVILILAYLWVTGWFTPGEAKTVIESILEWFKP
jgi:hypothetical protein